MSSTKYAWYVEGNQAFHSAVAEAIEEELQPEFTALQWEEGGAEFRQIHALQISKKLNASATSTVAIAFGTWLLCKFADNVFDDVYAQTFKPAIANAISRVLKKVRAVRGDEIEYQSLVYFDDLDVSVLIRYIVKTEDDSKKAYDLIIRAHKIANDWLRKHGKCAAIHCYIVEDGNCSLEPELYESFAAIKNQRTTIRKAKFRIEDR